MPPSGLEHHWRGTMVLKRDPLSTIERGRFRGPDGEAEAILRRIDLVPWWSAPLARYLLARERKALTMAGALRIAPPLLFADRRALVRGFIDGVAMQIARPYGERAYFQSAMSALRRLHRIGICHNDLAKEPNWLRGSDGRAYLTDFQLAVCFRHRGRLFRIAAYEDLRHLLKHKRRYVPEALTAAETRVLARKSWFARLWMATGKKLYRFVTRRLLQFADREGSGLRLTNDAPLLATEIKRHPSIRDAIVVALPDRGGETSLYAFVEIEAELSERDIREFVMNSLGAAIQLEQIQIVDALPRTASGQVRTGILQLIAMNQIDLLGPLIDDDAERKLVERIVLSRKNR